MMAWDKCDVCGKELDKAAAFVNLGIDLVQWDAEALTLERLRGAGLYCCLPCIIARAPAIEEQVWLRIARVAAVEDHRGQAPQ